MQKYDWDWFGRLSPSKKVGLAILTVFSFVVILASLPACSFAVGNGRVYLFDVLETVKVTNNTVYPLDVERNGEYFGPLSVGESCSVQFHTTPNLIITVKAYQGAGSARRYIGVAEQTFYPRGRIGEGQTWIVTYVQQPHR